MFASSVKNADSPFRNTACQNQNGARRTSRNRTIYAMPLSASGYGETDAPARRIRFWLDRRIFERQYGHGANAAGCRVAVGRHGQNDKTVSGNHGIFYEISITYRSHDSDGLTAKLSPDFGLTGRNTAARPAPDWRKPRFASFQGRPRMA